MELNQLKYFVTNYRQGLPAVKVKLESVLRDERRKLLDEFLTVSDEEAQQLFSGEREERFQLLKRTNIQNLLRNEEESGLLLQIIKKLEPGKNYSHGPLLAAMLISLPFEIPLPADMLELKKWFRLNFIDTMLTAPEVFKEIGESARYAEFIESLIDLIHKAVVSPEKVSGYKDIQGMFVSRCNLIQLYFNEKNLKKTYRQRAEIMESWVLDQGALLTYLFPFTISKTFAEKRRKIRVGILSGHFYSQTETYFMLSHFDKLPREIYEIRLYSLTATGHQLEQYCISRVDKFTELPKDLSFQQKVDMIREDDLDILLIGSNISVASSPITILSMFRMARIQVVTASSPISPGFTQFDYYLSAAFNEPGKNPTSDYSENLYMMPGMLNYYAYQFDKDPLTMVCTRKQLGIPEDSVVFFSGANFYKVLPELSALWVDILTRVENSFLLLMPFNPNWSSNYQTDIFINRINEQIEQAGVNSSRILLHKKVPTRADLHSFMALCDIYLDSFPFAGACSLLDPLLVNLPIVTRKGKTFRGGVGAAMMKAAGLEEMIAEDEKEYVEMAVALGNDKSIRQKSSVQVREAIEHDNPFYDTAACGVKVAASFKNMIENKRLFEIGIFQKSLQELKKDIENISHHLKSNHFFHHLNDNELIRQLLIPYFQSLGNDGKAGHLIDVGACFGQLSLPFLHKGWSADLFEPDPACNAPLQSLVQKLEGKVRLFQQAICENDRDQVMFYQSETGLSGLGHSPFSQIENQMTVRGIRLDTFETVNNIERVDMLKVDAEGFDFNALLTHDFERLPLKIAMIEYGTHFSSQSLEDIQKGIDTMNMHGYNPIIFSYEDNGKFKQRIWEYQLIGITFDKPLKNNQNIAMGNIIFYHKEDTYILSTLLYLLKSYLPAAARNNI